MINQNLHDGQAAGTHICVRSRQRFLVGRAKYVMTLISMICVVSAVSAEDSYVPCKRFNRSTECIAVPLASMEQDAVAKTFCASASDKAKVYIVRSYTIEPKTKTEISVDGEFFAELAPLTYAVFDLDPGTHQLKAHTDHDFWITLELKPGKTYYINHQLTLLFNTVKGALKMMDEEDGQAAVLRTKLVKPLERK